MAVNEVYQYSIVSALMDGIASTGLPVSELLTHGDHGLGTFRHLVGEMILLDGKLYQMKSDGTVTEIDTTSPSTTTTTISSSAASNNNNKNNDENEKAAAVSPFAMVTRFRPQKTLALSFVSKKDLEDRLSSHFPDARNLFLAYRMDGAFRNVTVRTAGGQQRPREGMVAVAERQTCHVFGGGEEGEEQEREREREQKPTRGTVFGFRSPAYTQGISVAGDHLHFIAEDRRRGGHVLEIGTHGEVEVGVACISEWRVELPANDAEFAEAKLERDAEGIAAVEG